METKKCVNCGEVKSINKFEKDKKCKSGRRNNCNSCRYKKRKQLSSFERRKTKCVEGAREWRENNPSYHKAYGKENSEYFKKKYKEWTSKNKDYHKKMVDAASKTNYFINKNGIDINTCFICGIKSSRIQKHHEDYDKPLTVSFLCASCHRRVHSGIILEVKSVDLRTLIQEA